MKTKTLGMGAVIAVVCFALFSASPAYAKSPQRYRWEGAAIGVGAALLGSALLRHPYPYRPDPPPFYRHPPHPPKPDCGRWEGRREWVPPRYDWVWIPGHYGRRGCWVPGHWEKRLIAPGGWLEGRHCDQER